MNKLLILLSILVLSLFVILCVSINKSEKFKCENIHQAITSGNMIALECIVEQGVDINTCDYNGWTSLHIAVQREDVRMVKFLLDNGADVKYRIAGTSATSLTLATNLKNQEIIRLLKHY